MKSTDDNTKIQQHRLLKRIANFFRWIWNVIRNWLSLQPIYVQTARMQSGESGISLDNFGCLKITSNVTLQDIEEFCEANGPLYESTKRDILDNMMGHLNEIGNTDDQNEVYRNIMRFIYKKGFDFNKKYSPDIYGNTMLLWDISYGEAITPEASLILLREFNASPFITDKAGKNALHFLLLKGHDVQRCIVDEVLNHKDIEKHINDKTVCGDTALHIAYARRDEKFITQLLEKGASLKIKNKNGQTPIDMLHLSEQERLEFLSAHPYLSCSAKLGFSSNESQLKRSSVYSEYSNIFGKQFDDVEPIEYFATIDKEIFNSYPQAIEAKIQDVKKTTAKEEVKSVVLQNPILSDPIKLNHSK